MADIYDFEARAGDGEPVPLRGYKGKVLLVVNTASRCGFTPQYAELAELHRKHASSGFAVLAFPCNQFGAQEPGSAEEIESFCRLGYAAEFPIFAKIEVNGPNAHPIFAFLQREKPGILGTRRIKWNFTTFLVDRNGGAVRRYAPRTRPAEIEPDILTLLRPAS